MPLLFSIKRDFPTNWPLFRRLSQPVGVCVPWH